MQLPADLEEIRVDLERIRTLLENLVVRGLRACGPGELLQIGTYAEHLERSGAGHLAALLHELRNLIERDDRTSARKLLETQTNVRLLERLLTLRVVKSQYAFALAAGEHSEASLAADLDEDEDIAQEAEEE
jgi:hypothetical protein